MLSLGHLQSPPCLPSQVPRGPGDMGMLDVARCPLRFSSSCFPLIMPLHYFCLLVTPHRNVSCASVTSLEERKFGILCITHLCLLQMHPRKAPRLAHDILPQPQLILGLSACMFQQAPPSGLLISLSLMGLIWGEERVNCIEP